MIAARAVSILVPDLRCRSDVSLFEVDVQSKRFVESLAVVDADTTLLGLLFSVPQAAHRLQPGWLSLHDR
jgi:hypothetical protein